MIASVDRDGNPKFVDFGQPKFVLMRVCWLLFQLSQCDQVSSRKTIVYMMAHMDVGRVADVLTRREGG